MDKIIEALKIQHKAIELLRKGIQLIQPEPNEATENLLQVETIYTDALIECGRLTQILNNGETNK